MTTARSIRLVCLDMAGTTVQDDGAVMSAFASAMDEVGIADGSSEREEAVAYTLATMGQPKIEVFRHLTGSAERAAVANAAFERAYLDLIRQGAAAPIEGAEDTVRTLRAGGIRVSFTTGFSAATRDALLRSLGWTGLADLALSPSDAGRGRPYPDMILTALIRLGIDDVREVANLGDTTSDALSGHRASASIVAGVLTGTHGADDFRTAPVTHVLGSVAELPSLLGL